MKLFALLAGLLLSTAGVAAGNGGWTVLRSAHFDVYSQANEHEARSVALWLEQLHAFFASGAGSRETDAGKGRVRLIEFDSAAEYAAFRPRPAADAFFIGGDPGNYIVMARSGNGEFQVAAHEYAHLILYSAGLRFPPWFAEGIAELFSSVHVGPRGCELGGDLPGRSLALRQKPLMGLRQLLGLEANEATHLSGAEARTFYAESWALTHMMVFSPAYAPRFKQLWSAMEQQEASDGEALARIYGKSLPAMMADLRGWIAAPKASVPLPGITPEAQRMEASSLTSLESRVLMADLLLACGDLARAESAYRAIQAERPDDATAVAALGSIELKKGRPTQAREQWRRAMQLGVRDAALCYRYALLAEDAGLPPEDIEYALRRATELRPDFDDARYRLGLLESNRGRYQAAVQQFEAMRAVSAARAYTYWTAMSNALTGIDRRDEARQAADKALKFATSVEERNAARRLAYVAVTDLTVQLAHDAKGNLQAVTARKPHGSEDWNPFIEPGDNIRSLAGKIRSVECRGGRITGFRVAGAAGQVEIAVTDPGHVLIRGGTPEFVCDAEDGRDVIVQYAASREGAAGGVLRGMEFK